MLANLWINIDEKQLWKFYNITDLRLLDCYYQPFIRFTERRITKTGGKKKLSYGERYPITDEFILVECIYGFNKSYSEYHIFLPEITEVLERVQSFMNESEKSQENKLNVMILGIDSLSRLNFHRTMQKTSETLDVLGGIEFLGYNKVGKF